MILDVSRFAAIGEAVAGGQKLREDSLNRRPQVALSAPLAAAVYTGPEGMN